jgi:hypothetical protein
MRKFALFFIIILISTEICFSQTKIDCYGEKIRINVKENIFVDTIVLFRNFSVGDDSKRIFCNGYPNDNELNKLVWGCKYIRVILKYQQKMNLFSIVSFRIQNKRDTTASFYTCNRKTKETVEMMRFKIEKRSIVGINIMPCCVNEFVPVDEFDNHKIDMID